jgi:ATP-binding cassette subfamily C (CFTR/MRP) protein 1
MKANAPTLLSGLATFAAFAIKSHIKHTVPLSTSQAFTSLALIMLLTGPATRLLQLFPSVIATKPCYNRIQKFLLAAKMEDSHRAFDNSGDWVFGDKHTMQDFSLIKATNLRLDVPFLTEGTPINFTICPGAVWMLSGPVGSGKSTMLKAILGETNLQEGTIELQSNLIGYCAQTPWLQNRSIKENIIGTNIEDEAWYRHVLYTCDLDQDISQMPDGHNTQVGNRGISISGGQKHRIVGHHSNHDSIALISAGFGKGPLFTLCFARPR